MVINIEITVVIKNFKPILGLIGALDTCPILDFFLTTTPIGNNINKIIHHIKQKKTK